MTACVSLDFCLECSDCDACVCRTAQFCCPIWMETSTLHEQIRGDGQESRCTRVGILFYSLCFLLSSFIFFFSFFFLVFLCFCLFVYFLFRSFFSPAHAFFILLLAHFILCQSINCFVFLCTTNPPPPPPPPSVSLSVGLSVCLFSPALSLPFLSFFLPLSLPPTLMPGSFPHNPFFFVQNEVTMVAGKTNWEKDSADLCLLGCR